MTDDFDMHSQALWTGYRRRKRNERYAIRVAQVLRVAVEFGIGTLQALEWFQEELRVTRWPARLWALHEWFRTRCFWLAWFPSAAWMVRVQGVISDCRRGIPLGDSLDRHMGRFFPRYYVVAIQKAEKEGRLDVVLPLMAKRFQYQQSLVDDRIPYLPYVWVVAAVVFLVYLGHRTFIMPVFAVMASDFGMTLPGLSRAVMCFPIQGLWMAIGAGIVIAVILKQRAVREALFPYLPLIAREKRRMLIRDLAQSMSVFLATGEDVTGAATRSLKATDNPWLRKHLERFVDEVRGGASWGGAWQRMGLGGFAYPWVIANAAAREDPRGGFDALAEWLHQDLLASTRAIRRWLSPCAVLVLALVVGAIACAVWSAIFQMGPWVMSR